MGESVKGSLRKVGGGGGPKTFTTTTAEEGGRNKRGAALASLGAHCYVMDERRLFI